MGIPDHLTCLLKNLYADQEARDRTLYGTTGSGLRKEYNKAVYCNCVYLCAEQIMQNAGLDKLQVGINTARKSTNNLRYADDTTLMEETKKN